MTLIVTYIRVLVLFFIFLKVGPLGLSCQAVIAFPVLDRDLLIPVEGLTVNSFETLESAFVTVMVSKPERTHILVF